MKLIIGLGNPGLEYKNTRHNVGFWLLDEFAKQNKLDFQEKTKFKGKIAEFSMGGQKVVLLKPSTFYNLSGDAARAVCDFYKISPENVLVIHDELALPFGTVRTRLSGSDAGNNGIKSLTATLGQNYARIRVGVYNELRDKMDDADFVLSKFSQEESEQLGEIAKKVVEFIESFINGGLNLDTHKL